MDVDQSCNCYYYNMCFVSYSKNVYTCYCTSFCRKIENVKINFLTFRVNCLAWFTHIYEKREHSLERNIVTSDQLLDISCYVKRLCNKSFISFLLALKPVSVANETLGVWGESTWRASGKMESTSPVETFLLFFYFWFLKDFLSVLFMLFSKYSDNI